MKCMVCIYQSLNVMFSHLPNSQLALSVLLTFPFLVFLSIAPRGFHPDCVCMCMCVYSPVSCRSEQLHYIHALLMQAALRLTYTSCNRSPKQYKNRRITENQTHCIKKLQN